MLIDFGESLGYEGFNNNNDDIIDKVKDVFKGKK